MDEHSGDTSGSHVAIGLDFSSADEQAVVRQLLEFAELLVVDDLRTANVVVGDGTHKQQHTSYIQLGIDQADAIPYRLSPLLGAIAQALGSTSGNIVEAALNFIGASDNAEGVRQAISSAASSDVTVLVTGESGTGKEVVARALHKASPRSQGPFVPINCGAIPGELLESELFGHEKGAFTGAITQKIGRFELAHGGTLFLDEIGDLPFTMQVKLLRALEDKSFERIGAVRPQISDVRIVAATNQNLEEKIAAGEFREDLYYRLNVFPIELSPLRERGDDVPLLINFLMGRIQAEQGLHVRFSVDALELLKAYPWPGNVRELSNLLNRLAIQYPNTLVRSVDLPSKYVEVQDRLESVNPAIGGDDVLLPVNGIDLKDYLTRLEKSLIEQALQDTNSVVARAADRLHIRRTTLVEKMRKHGLGRTLETVQ